MLDNFDEDESFDTGQTLDLILVDGNDQLGQLSFINNSGGIITMYLEINDDGGVNTDYQVTRHATIS